MSQHQIATTEGLQRLAQIVQEARGKRSYRDFGEATEISHATVRRLEKGEVDNPEVHTLQKLAPYTPYNVSELVAIVSGRPPEEVRKIFTASDIWPHVEQLPVPEQQKLLLRLIDRLCGSPTQVTRLQFQGWIHEKIETLSLTTKIPSERLLAIVQGVVPKPSELVDLAEAMGVAAETVIMLYPEISPATMKQAARAAASHHARAKPGSPLSGGG